ncbi:MAG: ATP-binding protein [Ruminococcaceae bacterium]|nr:ATP-binding protein [Oscillospiraceae bacterium]
MQELSLNILDVANNSVKAGAKFVNISLNYDDKNYLKLTVSDDGSGMTKEVLSKLKDPFYTSRTTRKVGLGIPFLTLLAEQTGGYVEIESEVGIGTKIIASFDTNSIDMLPIGNLGSTASTLISGSPDVDFVFHVSRGELEFTLDSAEIKILLDGVPVSTPQVALFIEEYANDNFLQIIESK